MAVINAAFEVIFIYTMMYDDASKHHGGHQDSYQYQ